MIKFNEKQTQFIELATKELGELPIITRDQVKKITEENNLPWPSWLVTDKSLRVGRGLYNLPNLTSLHLAVTTNKVIDVVDKPTVKMLKQYKLQDDSDQSIPELWQGYVPFGFYKDLKKIVSNNSFYPIFITGLSGNGKTLMVEQVCAILKRECIRVNISVETDESDLLGGPTLIDGNVVNRDGPVLTAMRRGAILLIDEVDRGSNKLMCLQGILEGKPYFNKKTGELVVAKEGFNVIATANTKGRGSDEGRYLSQILDDAFLERFPITVEQEFPDVKTERAILKPLVNDEDFTEKLVQWADVVRKTFDAGGVDELISTRRLVHIAKAYGIFKDRKKAVQLCVNRFDEDTKLAFIDLYNKIDAGEDLTIQPEVDEPF